jgi:hypothetical protein
MATSYLPDADHILRHVGFPLLIRDSDERVIGCFPQAFELRPNESYLSTSWLEFFGGTKMERLRAAINACSKARTVKPSHGFAIGNVGEVKEACAGFNLRIRVIHEPSDDNPNPAYTAVRRYRSDDIELLELLAGEAWSEVIEVKDYL